MTQNKKRIRNRISTGIICPSCQGPKENRAKICKACRNIEVAAQAFAPIRTCVDCDLDYPNKEMHYTRCIPCSKANKKAYTQTEVEKERIKIRSKEWRQNNPDKVKRLNIIRCLRAINLLDQFDYIESLLNTQKECSICGTHTDVCGTLHIDHDHITGAFRGLLCATCNSGIGMLKDSPEVLASAIEYLIKSRS